MNRILKFRAWGKIDKKMHTPGKLNVLLSNLDPLEVPMWWNSAGDEVVWMQFTGLHDKNGNKIYEGDICRKYYGVDEPLTEIIFEVIFLNGCFTGKEIKSTGFYYMEWPSEYFDSCEVIGNIYENPELLETKKT